MSKVAWGILSTARIALDKVIPAMQRAANCEIVAIASRDQARAEQAAKKLGIARAHGSYEALLADPGVQAVYNPLPNHLHVPLSLLALAAGKHVLCEKPLAPTAAEAQQLVRAAHERPELKVMEAFMYRHHPQWIRAKQLATRGGIGTLRTVQTAFSYYNDNPADIRNQAAMGGGALRDIGCYAISLARFLFDAEPRRVWGVVELDARFHTDRLSSGCLDFGAGTSTFTCSTQLSPYQRVNIFGTEGRVEIEIPFNAPPDRPCRLWHERQGAIEEIRCEVCDQYTIQGELFSAAILENGPVPTPLSDAVANMRVIEALEESARRGCWMTLA